MIFQTTPSFKKKLNSVVFIHDVLFRSFPQFFTWKERLYFFPLRWLIPRANRLIATTQFGAKELLRLKYAKDISQITIVPLGVSSEFKPIELHDSTSISYTKEKLKLPDSFILFVGRLNARKNILNLLKAIPLLNDVTLQLVIVGTKDGKPAKLQTILSDKKIKERVVITGNISNEELPKVYALAKIFCFPSFAEGFGLPPLEAMASGVPVVVSNSTALPEVCGNAAIYTDPSKPENIAQALNSLLENRDLYLQKKREGLEHAAKYNWNTTIEKLMQAL